MATTPNSSTTNGTTPLPTSSSSAGPVRVWLDSDKLYASATDNIQQPQTQQFANFEATPSAVLNGTVIDMNPHVVVYTVKNGLIRILHRHSTLRTLLRAHYQQQVTDIRFFQDGDVLATVGSSSNDTSSPGSSSSSSSSIVIWRIYEGASEIMSDKILEIATPHLHITRVVWHPFNPNQFWMIHSSNKSDSGGGSSTVVATLVETTNISTQQHPEGESHAVCVFYNDSVIMQGAVQLKVDGGANLTDLAWSGRDTRHVLTTHDSGEIILWDLKQTTPSGDVKEPARLYTIQNGNEKLSRCLFLPHENIISNGGTANEQCLTTCFATASDNNSIITLWSPFVAPGSTSTEQQLPTKVQVVSLAQEAASSTSYLVDVVFGPAPPDASPPSCFLLMADRSSGKIYALHCRALWSSAPDTNAQQQQQHRSVLLEGCDYVVPFTTRYPTFAWSVVCSPSTDIAEESLTEQGSLIFDMKLFAYQSRLVQCLTLTSYMCLPPPSTTTNTNTTSDVVRVERLDGTDTGVKTTMSRQISEIVSEEEEGDDNKAKNNDGAAPEQYDEDYDVGDDEEDDDVYADADPGTAASPPGIATAGSGGSGSANPFANWLGAIASTGPAPAQSPAPPGLAAATTPGLPPPPAAQPVVQAPPASALPGGPPLQGGFLSPSDFGIPQSLSNSSSQAAAAAAPAAVAAPAQKSPGKKKEKKAKKRTTSPVPPAAGGIQILKKQDAVENKSAPPSPAAAAAAAAPVTAAVDMDAMRRLVREEVQSQVVPAVKQAVSQAMQPMQSNIQQLVQKGVAVDNDKIALSMSESVDAPLQAAFAQSIKTVLIPTLESVTGQIFGKVSQSLDQGLSNATAQAASAAAQAAAANGGGGAGAAPKLEAISTQLSTMTALVTELTGEVQSLRDTVTAQQTAAAAASSQPTRQQPRAPAVSDIETLKSEIMKLLSEQNYEQAFTKAVSSTTAELAVFCCTNADLTEVLGCADDVKLSQPILICLMQQLGTVVGSPSHTSNLQVELEWLQDIALSLDPKDVTIQQHIPRVLQQLVANINARLAAGDPALRRPLQRLLSILRGIRIG